VNPVGLIGSLTFRFCFLLVESFHAPLVNAL
jgi:hypothetical protein